MNILVLIVLVTAGSDQLDGAVIVGTADTMENCAAMAAKAERLNADFIEKLAERGIVPVAACIKVGAQPALPETKLLPRKDDTPT